MQIALILNPTAGTSLGARQNLSATELETILLEELRKRNREAEVYYTTLEDAGEGIARRLAEKHTDLVIAGGGDGTIHAVARGLLGSASTLGIIPMGTMNNLAHSLGIPENLSSACDLLVDGEARALDVGCINQHIFLEVAGVGLEAALYPAAEAVKSRGVLSMFRGALGGLWTLFTFRPPQMKVTFDQEKPRTYRAMQITVCNAPFYGVRLNVASGISMNDGWLNAVLYTNFSKSEYIRHALSISQGKRPFTPKIVSRRVRTLRIQANTPIEIHADGVVIGHTPAEVSLLPGVLKVLVPRTPVPGLLPEKSEQQLHPTRFARKRKAYV